MADLPLIVTGPWLTPFATGILKVALQNWGWQVLAMKSTPLENEHIKLGAKMVEFAGWHMPVEYEGLRTEHQHVRQKVGLFDVSHMGEIRIRGPQALETLQWLTTNDVSKIGNGQAQYSLLPNERGGVVDDLIIYCVERGQDYLLCVNASNTDKDWEWIKKNNRGAELINESELWGQIAVQGPRAVDMVAHVFSDPNIKNIKGFHFEPRLFAGSNCYLARTGYTGEDGFEIFVPAPNTAELWRQLLAAEQFEPKPIGLGARDTLRTEMKYSLYGQELGDDTSPYEAGLGWVIKPEAKDFIGKDKIVSVKTAGLKNKLVGFQLVDKGIARHDYKVLSVDNVEIGKVTSGTLSPTLGVSIGIALISAQHASEGQEILVDIRGRPAKAKIVSTPFVKNTSLKK